MKTSSADDRGGELIATHDWATGLLRMATSVAGHGHLLHFDRGDVHNLVVYFVQVADFVARRLDCKGYVTANLREN